MRLLYSFITTCCLLLISGFSSAQTVTVIAPNGGEILYACQQYPVTWSQTGSPSNYWNIDYSLDGGTIWASVTSNYLSSNGTFLWTVPNVQSTTVKMRIYDAQNPSTVDQSNNFFTINIPVILTSPNGGEVWQGNTVHNITWNALGTSNTYNIAYSINGGSNWINIVTNHINLTGSYAWTVPTMALSENCLVRVMDAVTNCMQDVSNAVFTITPSTPILLAPNGGETYQIGCGSEITWDETTIYNYVRLDYTIDNGATWTNIVNGASNYGYYYWYPAATIPPSTQYKVRLSNYLDLSVWDISDNVFTIPTGVTVVAPNGGETITGCSNTLITWNKTNCLGSWIIAYSTDNGVNWNNIITTSDNGLNTQSYNWTVPNGINAAQSRIRVQSSSYSNITDQTNANFTLAPTNEITLTSPNGGENWVGLSSHNITWTNLPSVSGFYTIQYSLNGGSNWINLATNITGNSYSLSVPNTPSTIAVVKIFDTQNNCKQDISEDVFTIAPATPILISPNGGETYQIGCGSEITWDETTIYNYVRLDYTIDNGATWTNIVNGASNYGYYYWYPAATIPPSTQYKVRLSNYLDLSVWDISDNVFTIPTGVTVVAPNGGETITGCSNTLITWNKTNCLGSWIIAYSTDNGVNWNNIITTSDNGLNTQSYNWTVPNGINAAQSRIRVQSSSYSNITDQTNANFTLAPTNEITLTSPNGGENWVGLSTQNITWTNLPSVSGFYTIQYSLNGGSNWVNLATNITGNSYSWSVPNTPSTIAVVKIFDTQNNCKQDISEDVFTIAPATPILLSPNGGETYQIGCGSEITWDETTIYNYVRLDYTIDNGATWTNIVNGASNYGYYYWYPAATIPPSTQYKVRLSNYLDLSVWDISDNVFTIPTGVTVVAPNGGETITGCSNTLITWNKTNCLGSWIIAYSTDNGVNWNNIITTSDNGLNTQSYNWTVPNGINAAQSRIRVQSSSYSNITDQTNANFTLAPTNEITLTSPNGGENWVGLSTQNITWTNLPSVSGFYTIQYSLNGGGNWITLATNITGNSYSWSVPNTPSTNAVVKVFDTQNSCKQDISEDVFTIAPATPILLSPNGGETYQIGCGSEITWDETTIYNYVRLDYTIDNGATWTNIVNGASNYGYYYWYPAATIPPSTQYKVRLSNYLDLSVWDISDNVFTIPTGVTVVAPNGGETITGCSNTLITWNKTNCLGSWIIAYSTDNGVNWNNIITTSDNGLNTQSYNWTVPNGINAAQSRIRVQSSSYSNITDQTNANFTLAPTNEITLTSPNGGENWVGLSTHNITWTNLPSVSGFYTIQYSLNGGGNWITLATNITGNSYSWSVPNTPSTNAVVKVFDTQNSCKQDISEDVFTIAPATPILLSPNGGETYQISCGSEITWDETTIYNYVRLDYTIDNGATWTNIVNGASNYGYYYWYPAATIPPSTQYKVRLSNYLDLSVWDISDNVFTIPTGVTVVAPNGGETITGCSNTLITWNKTNCLGSWIIAYSTDNGVNWNNIITTSDNGLNTQSYNWTVPNGINAAQSRIRVQSSSYSNITDQTNANFTLAPTNEITLTSPNGGENWVGLSTHNITWTNLPSVSGFYTIQYSLNGGGNWITLATNITGNSYSWSVPNTPSTIAVVKVFDTQNNCKQDISEDVFTIAPATPILLSPNGGEVLYSGQGYEITWDETTIYNYVRLDYSLDNGVTWTNIVNGASNYGYYYWYPPNVSSTTALVRISNYLDLSVWDISEEVFTIKPAVTIITPNGDDGITLWGGCTITSITFERSPAWSNYRIEYSTNNGSTWNLIVSNWSTSANPATYNWTMPNLNNVPTLVRVYPTSYSQFADQSDNTFTIRKPVTIIQPNFGGIMQIGTTYNIQWTSDGISNLYDIFYSTNGGASFTNIVTGYNTSNNTFPWLVPNIPSSNCRIWVRDNVNSCKSDTSDIAFIISPTPGPITIQTPNGVADTLQGCQTKLINWTETTAFGNYDIHYSINGGSTWTAITTNYATSNQSYSWAVPNINSSTVLLRVRQAGSSTNVDLSDAYFVIEQRAVVATPPTTTLCPGQSIQLLATGGNTYTWSPSSGLSNAAIANPVATPAASTQYIVQSIIGACTLRDTLQVNVTPASLTASVSIQASVTGTICTGTSVTFTATPQNGGTNPSYQWKVNGSNVGTNSGTFSSSSLTNNAVVTCVMTSDIPCIGSNPATSNAITMQVSSALTPTVSVSASPSTTACFGTSVTFTAAPVNGGSSPTYQWKLNGINVGSNSATFSSSSLNNNDVISVVMTSNASCLATSSATSSNVTMTINNLPGQPGSIIGNTNACVGSTQTYQVTASSGATSYTWSFPSGWTGTSTTNSISVTAGTAGGPITVTPVNGCGNGAPQQTSVTPNNVPAQPGLISGNNSFCQGNALSYSITAVNGANSYSWNLPEGWTGNSSTTSISAIAGSASGNISVSANNTCGSSTAQTLAVNAGNAPAQPEAITGNTSYCPGEALQYSIPPVNGAISYSWTMPTGWTGTSITNSISTISSIAGTISVAANGTCGSSVAQTLSVAPLALPAQPTFVNGNETLCSAGETSFSVAPLAGADTYVWTLSGGLSGTSTSTFINVLVSGTGGTLSVAGQNTCLENGPVRTLEVVIPQLDTSIVVNGAELIANATGVAYQWLDCGNSFEPIDGATEAQFTVPTIGSYALQVSQDGCSATSSCVEITVVGKERVQAEKGITIYPNPSHARITISTEKPVEISIYNALGGLIDRFELNGSRELYIGDLANGVYFLQTNNQGNYRIVKH